MDLILTLKSLEIHSIDVYHPPHSKSIIGLNEKNLDLLPYCIDIFSKNQERWRVIRSFSGIIKLHEKLNEYCSEIQGAGPEVPMFPPRKVTYLGGLFGGKFPDSETGETRRQEIAKYFNNLFKFFNGHASALKEILYFFTPIRLFEAILDNNLAEITNLISSGLQHPLDSEPVNKWNSLHFCANQSSEEGNKCTSIAEYLLSTGGDIHVEDNKGRSAFILALEKPFNKQTKEWNEFIELLIQSGSDLYSISPTKHSVLHLCIPHLNLVKLVVERAPLQIDTPNPEGVTPYSAAETNYPDASDLLAYLRSSAAKKDADVKVLEEIFDSETKKFDEFLNIASERKDFKEQVDLLLRLADLHQLEYPIVSVKYLNSALHIAVNHGIYNPEIYTKLFQSFSRVATFYSINESKYSLSDHSKRTDAIKKRITKLKEARNGMNTQISKQIDTGMKWITDRFLSIFKEIIDETVKLIADPSPTPWAIVILGDLAKSECTPKSKIEFAILVENYNFSVLKYFKGFTKFLEIGVINLQETPFNVLNYRTFSPIDEGLCFDQLHTPFVENKRGPYKLIGTPLQIASLQEPDLFNNDAYFSSTLAQASYFYGEKRLFDEYKGEIDRIYNRKADTKQRPLRQQRALNILRTEIGEFVPKYNRDISAEKYFELARNLSNFPTRVINILCLYYKIEGASTWEKIDKLASTSLITKDGAKRLKSVFTTIAKLYLQSNESKVMDISNIVAKSNENLLKRFAKQESQNIICNECNNDDNDGDDDDDNKDHTTDKDENNNHDDGDQDNNNDNIIDSDNPKKSEEDELISLRSSKKKETELYKLTANDIEEIINAFLVIIPLHATLKEWFNTVVSLPPPGTAADDILKKASFFDNGHKTKASAYFRICYYEKAAEYYTNAINEEPDNHNLINLFGMMWNKIGDYEKAIEYYGKSVDAIIKIKGEKCSELSALYNNLAMANINLKKQNEAIPWLEKGLSLDEELYGKNHASVSNGYHNLGLLYRQEKEFEKALEYLNTALSIDKDLYNENSSYLASDFNDIARVYQDLGEFQEALSYFQKALSIDQEIYTGAHPTVANRFVNIANIYNLLGEKNQSLEYEEKALSFYLKIHGEDHLVVGTSLYHCAKLYYHFDNLEKSLEYLKRSYQIHKLLLSETHPETIQVKEFMLLVEKRLRRKLSMTPEEYEEWKRKLNENNVVEEESSMWMEEAPGEEEDDNLVKAPKILGSGKVQAWKGSVFDDDFFEL